MAPGDLCDVEDPTCDQTHGDVLHPCVRFVENGFEGHTWWMTYTPCYDTPALENPVLCYADGPGNKPPTNWRYFCSIVGSPKTGYNSDPTLLFRDGKCFVHWREYRTPRAQELGGYEVTSGGVVENRAVRFNEAPQLVECAESQDREISPTFISLDGVPRAYAVHIRLKKRKNPPTGIRRLVGKIPAFLHRLGLCLPKGAGGWRSGMVRPRLDNSLIPRPSPSRTSIGSTIPGTWTCLRRLTRRERDVFTRSC